MKSLRLLSVLLVVGATAVLAEQPIEPLERGVAAHLVNQPPIKTMRAELALLAGGLEVDRLVAKLRDLAGDASMHPVAREHLLREGVMHLSQLEPTSAARALVAELGTRAPAVHVWLSEGHYRTPVPLYDVGAAARFALRNWAREAARTQTRQALARGTTEYLGFFSEGADYEAQRLGAVDAFEEAPAGELLLQRDGISAAMQIDRSIDPVVLALASRLADKPLFLKLIETGEPTAALRAIPAAVLHLAQDDALDVLQAASSRPSLASAAILATGTLAQESSRAREHLLQALRDERHGGSAAVALSRLKDAGVVLALRDVLQSGDNEHTKRRAILALRLDGTPDAFAALERFAEDPSASPALKHEVRKWLHD